MFTHLAWQIPQETNTFSLWPQPLTSKRQVLRTYTETVYMTRSCVHLLSASLLSLFCHYNYFLYALALFGHFSWVNKNKIFTLPLVFSIHCLHQHTGVLNRTSVMLRSATGHLLSTSKCIYNTIKRQGHNKGGLKIAELGCSLSVNMVFRLE